MSAPGLILLALALSVGVAALALGVGAAADRSSGDPTLRDRLWAGLLLSPLLALGLAGLAMLLPAPVEVIEAQVAAGVMTQAVTAPQASGGAGRAVALDMHLISWGLIGVVGLATVLKAAGLALRAWRLKRLLAGARSPSQALEDLVARAAAGLAVRSPELLVSVKVTEPLLVGPRARLVLPLAFETSQDNAAIVAVLAHEMAHLKRGDHRALWLEEGLMIALAFNPLMPLLRHRRDAAREEACDALALAGTAPEVRRAYAHRLIEALRDRAGPQPLALTFTGAGRAIAMNRLKAILSPAAPAGRRARLVVTAVGLGLAAAMGAGSWAVAAQRPAEVRVAPLATQEAPVRDRAAVEARYRGLSAEGFRGVCASADVMDEGYCAGVMLGQLVAPDSGVCGPAVSDRQALMAYVAAGKTSMRRIAPRTDEGANGYAQRVLSDTFPCPANGEAGFDVAAVDMGDVEASDMPAPPVGGGRLWVRVDAGAVQVREGDRLVVRLAGLDSDGVAYEHVSEVSTGPDGVLPSTLFLDLGRDYFPGLGQRRAYELTAEIRRDGQAVYVADSSTIRLAPNSQGSLNRVRPVLEMRPA